QPDIPLRGREASAGTLNVEHQSSRWQQSGKLVSLDAANFLMVGGHDESRYVIGRAEVVEIVGVAAQQGPANAHGGGGVRHLRKNRGPGWFEEDGVGAKIGCGLDFVKKLLA